MPGLRHDVVVEGLPCGHYELRAFSGSPSLLTINNRMLLCFLMYYQNLIAEFFFIS